MKQILSDVGTTWERFRKLCTAQISFSGRAHWALSAVAV